MVVSHWSLLLAKWSENDWSDIFLNAWTSKSSTLCQGTLCWGILGMLRECIILPLPLLPACTGLKTNQGWETGALLCLSSHARSPACICGLPNPWQYVRPFQRPMNISFPGFPFIFLSRLLFAPTGAICICDIKRFLLVVFHTYPGGRAFELWSG